jgi:hypothetical protein
MSLVEITLILLSAGNVFQKKRHFATFGINNVPNVAKCNLNLQPVYLTSYILKLAFDECDLMW